MFNPTANNVPHTLLFFKDFEEQLDQKERVIKQLANQMISLETAQKGNLPLVSRCNVE